MKKRSRAQALKTAEQCFAMARSTTHDGERANAIARGLALCDQYEIDPAQFDVPGGVPPDFVMSGKVRTAQELAAYEEALRRYWAAVQEARAREERFHHLCAEAKEADRRHDLCRAAKAAADDLCGSGIMVYTIEPGLWAVYKDTPAKMTDRELVMLAGQLAETHFKMNFAPAALMRQDQSEKR